MRRFRQLFAVSTHSRPKAAGKIRRYPPPWVERFNTQPPEGGWTSPTFAVSAKDCFNTQPPEGGWGFAIRKVLE